MASWQIAWRVHESGKEAAAVAPVGDGAYSVAAFRVSSTKLGAHAVGLVPTEWHQPEVFQFVEEQAVESRSAGLITI
jgi:hypothetical protein